MMMKDLSVIVAASIVLLTASVSAVDIGQHHVRRLASSENVETQEEQFRMIVLKKLQQFEAAYTTLEKEHATESDDDTKCVPCSDSNGEYGTSERGRMLKLLPNLVSRVKSVIPDDSSENDFMVSLVTDSSNQIFGAQENVTMGGIFDSISDSPLLFVGGLALALVVILPLAILEATSLTTGTPILCILGFASSILFGECRRRDLTESTAVRQLLDASFFTKYFPNGRIREVDEDSADITSDLRELVQIGLSSGVKEYLNNVTVASFVYDIATHNATRPLTSTALLAITPVLMTEQISSITNTPVKCIIGNCRNRVLQTTSDAQCEIEYFRCQMKKILMI